MRAMVYIPSVQRLWVCFSKHHIMAYALDTLSAELLDTNRKCAALAVDEHNDRIFMTGPYARNIYSTTPSRVMGEKLPLRRKARPDVRWEPVSKTSPAACSSQYRVPSLGVNSLLELVVMFCRDEILFVSYKGQVERLNVSHATGSLHPQKPFLYYLDTNKRLVVSSLVRTPAASKMEIKVLCSIPVGDKFRKFVVHTEFLYGISLDTIASMNLTSRHIQTIPFHRRRPNTDGMHICLIP